MTTGTPASSSSSERRPRTGKARRTPHRPPAELIVVVVLTYLAGFVAIGLGILFILLRYAAQNGLFGGEFTVTLIGAIVILGGLFIIAMASALTRGKHYARVLTTVGMAVEFALAVVSLIVDADSYWLELVMMAVAVLVTIVLWLGRSGRYFAHISAQDAAARRTGL